MVYLKLVSDEVKAELPAIQGVYKFN